jgi:hypothetical protein
LIRNLEFEIEDQNLESRTPNPEPENDCGKNLHESQSQAGAEIQGAHAQPVLAVRSFARLFAEVPALPLVFPRLGSRRGNSRSDQVELVIRMTSYELRIANEEAV